MSYLARLKKIETEKNFDNSHVNELTKPPKDTSVSFVSTVQAVNEKNILLIQSWLFQIDEPKENHYLVLDKCRNDSEAMEYFLKHARGEYE